MNRISPALCAVCLLLGCAHDHGDVPSIGAWDSCVYEPMSLSNYTKSYHDMRDQADVFLRTLRRLEQDPAAIQRYIAYWEKRSELLRATPDEFPLESDWAFFKACAEEDGARAFTYEGRKGDYSENGMLVVKAGRVLCRHKTRWGTTRRH